MFAIMRKSLGVILALVACGTLVAGYPLRVLVLSTEDKIIFLRVVKPEDSFVLGYLHSVELSDVWERFVIDSDYRIVLTETMFQGQGAGLPTSLSGNEKLTRDGKWFRIIGMERIVPHIYWRVGAKWHNRFRYQDGAEQNVSKMLGDALVLIQVRRIRVVNWLGYHLMGLDP